VIEFEILSTGKQVVGNLKYLASEGGLVFEPIWMAPLAVEIGYLELAVDEDYLTVSRVTGFLPPDYWIHCQLEEPKALSGELKVSGDIEMGVAVGLVEAGEWPVYFDDSTGWICVGHPESKRGDVSAEFATGSVAVVNDRMLRALWLHPEFV
jgi:hypothetical protein